MKLLHLDTHVVVWLYAGLIEKFPEIAKILVESYDLIISPAVILEMQYLYEIKRINNTAAEIVDDLRVRIGLQVDDLPFELTVHSAIDLHWTRDPFDRLIAACAISRSYPLLTKDETLLKNLSLAVWDNPKSIIQI